MDSFGIPVLRFHFKWSEHEINQVQHMEDTFTSIIETMGGTVIGPKPEPEPRHFDRRHHHPRSRRRCAWASDPKTSVLNAYCQAHEVKNLFVCDAAPFVSQPDKNVTLSIVAFAWRASEYLAEEMRKGNV